MHVHQPASFDRFARTAVAALAISLMTSAATGCNAGDGGDPNLRSDLASIRNVHGNPDAIGSLDPSATPANLDAYQHAKGAGYRTVSAKR
jgi:hypothetical protein